MGAHVTYSASGAGRRMSTLGTGTCVPFSLLDLRLPPASPLTSSWPRGAMVGACLDFLPLVPPCGGGWLDSGGHWSIEVAEIGEGGKRELTWKEMASPSPEQRSCDDHMTHIGACASVVCTFRGACQSSIQDGVVNQSRCVHTLSEHTSFSGCKISKQVPSRCL